MWALIKDGEVLKTADQPSTVIPQKKSHFKDYRWVKVTEDTGTPVKGDAFYHGMFIGPSIAAGDIDIDAPYFKQVERSDVKVTTGSTLATYVELVTDNLNSGSYKLNWTYGWNIATTQNNFIAQMELEDKDGNITLVFDHKQKVKDSSGDFMGTSSDQRLRKTSFKAVTLEGICKIRLNFCTDSKKAMAAMWDARIDIRRES